MNEPAGFPPTTRKIVSRAAAAEWSAAERAAGRRVVLANGAFDLLHVGHLRYLEAARAAGDRLLVAVNSDLSVRLSKGPSRPILPEAERAELVASLEAVDRVFLFDDRTVEQLLREMRPAVHAKGTDYTVESVPERAVAAEIGARTVITGDPKDHATTDLVANIRKRFPGAE